MSRCDVGDGLGALGSTDTKTLGSTAALVAAQNVSSLASMDTSVLQHMPPSLKGEVRWAANLPWPSLTFVSLCRPSLTFAGLLAGELGHQPRLAQEDLVPAEA